MMITTMVVMLLVTPALMTTVLYWAVRLFAHLVADKDDPRSSKWNIVLWLGLVYLFSALSVAMFYATAIIVLVYSNKVVPSILERLQ